MISTTPRVSDQQLIQNSLSLLENEITAISCISRISYITSHMFFPILFRLTS